MSLRALLGGSQPPPSHGAVIRGFLGGFLGIGSIGLLAHLSQMPLLIAPFGASCVLLFGAPHVPLAQPRNVIGGHVVAALIALLISNTLGTDVWFVALGVGTAIGVMIMLKIVHPPAGANPIVILTAGVSDWSFAFTPIFVGASLLVIIALIVNNSFSDKKWPERWT